jgi:hypothetical protein
MGPCQPRLEREHFQPVPQRPAGVIFLIHA